MGRGRLTLMGVVLALALVLLPQLVPAVSLEHRVLQRHQQRMEATQRLRTRTAVSVRGDDDDGGEDSVVEKSPVPPVLPVEMKVLKDEAEFPPNQPGAPKAPALAAAPGDTPPKPLNADGSAPKPRFASLRGDDEEGEDGSGGDDESKDGPAPVKTGKKKGAKGDGEDGEGEGEEAEESDEDKEKKEAATNGTVVPRKAFPQSRPLPQRGSLKPPLSSPPRWLFSMVKIANKLIIFGGVASYSHDFWNDLWEYDFKMSEWRNEQASYIPPFPASNAVFQKPPENEFYRPQGIPAPPPLGIEPLANEDEDPINHPAGGAADLKGEPKDLSPEIANPDPSAVEMAGGGKLPSAPELKKMQENEARKQKLAAQKRREKLSPAARLKAKRQRMLRRKRLEARLKKQAEAKKHKELKALEHKWRAHFEKKWDAEKKLWEKTHKHSVTIDMKGDESPVSVSISKKVTPATDEQANKENEAEAEAAGSGGSGGSGGSEREHGEEEEHHEKEEQKEKEKETEHEKEHEKHDEDKDESDGSAEDEARFRLKNSARFVQVDPRTGEEQFHRRRRHSGSSGIRSHQQNVPTSMASLFAHSEPVTNAETSSQQPHRQWMGEFGLSFLEVHTELTAQKQRYHQTGNPVMAGIMQQRIDQLYGLHQRSPRYSSPTTATALFQLSQHIAATTRSGFGADNVAGAGAGADAAANGAIFAGANADAAAALNSGAASAASATAGLSVGMASTVQEDGDDEKDGSGLDPDADHAVVQDQQNPKYRTAFVGDEVWEFNIDTKKWKFVKKLIRLGAAFPQPRWLHSAVVIDGKMVVFGGVNPDSVILGDVWMFDPDTAHWTEAKVEGVPILPREGHTAIAVGNTMIVFGGISYAYSPFNDVWTYLSSENKWQMNKIEGQKPAPRWMHTAVLHAAKSGARSMFVFGGITHQYVPLNDLWQFELASSSWHQPKCSGHAPFPRMLHAALIYEDTMFIHGGAANNMMHEDLWRIDVADDFAWEEQLPSGASPFARMGHQIQLVSPPINPTPYRDNRPPWTAPDNSVPAPKTPKPFPLRPRKEYSTNRFMYLFGGARNSPSTPTGGFVARSPGTHAMPGPNPPGLGFGFPTPLIN